MDRRNGKVSIRGVEIGCNTVIDYVIIRSFNVSYIDSISLKE